MRTNKLVALISAAVMVGTIGVTASFAANSSDNAVPKMKMERIELTDEQKAQMDSARMARETQMNATNEKWAALTDEQKAEIYALKGNCDNAETAIIDKYLEWGLIDETTATDMKTQMAERFTQMKESGRMPMMGNRGGRGGRDGVMKGERPEMTEEQQAQMKIDMEARLAQDVADGKITQAQADEIIENGGKVGMPQGMGRGMKRERPAPPTDTTNI